jgi:hypothetical protein
MRRLLLTILALAPGEFRARVIVKPEYDPHRAYFGRARVALLIRR